MNLSIVQKFSEPDFSCVPIFRRHWSKSFRDLDIGFLSRPTSVFVEGLLTSVCGRLLLTFVEGCFRHLCLLKVASNMCLMKVTSDISVC